MGWAKPSRSSSSSGYCWSQPQIHLRFIDPNSQSAAADIDVAGSNPLGSQHAGSAASSSSSSSAHNPWGTYQLLLHALHAVLERCGLSAPDGFFFFFESSRLHKADPANSKLLRKKRSIERMRQPVLTPTPHASCHKRRCHTVMQIAP
jgi:hypothetical protein